MTTAPQLATPTLQNRAARALVGFVTSALVLTGLPFTPGAGASSGPLPGVSLSVPSTALLGQSLAVTATYTNSSLTLSDIGYGPYFDLILPGSGPDGAATAPGADGITFTSASYLGIPLTPQILACPPGGGVFPAHPITGNTGPVCNEGDQKVVARYPIGSYAPGNPSLDADIVLAVSGNADVGTAMAIRATAGFEFGNSPVGTPITSGTTVTSSVTPALYDIRKTYNGPEHETATGPNYVRSYTVVADIATGQTLTNFSLRDTLPAGFAYVNSPTPTTSPSGASITLEPNPASVAAEPASPSNGVSASDNIMQATWSTITGGGSSSDATLTFSYYVPRQYNSDQPTVGSDPVISASTADDNPLQDTATSSATWAPTDTRDATTPVTRGPVNDTMTAKAIATQKSATVFSDTGAAGATPSDILKYTIDIQVSDYFNFSNVVVNSDVLGDGQTMLTETDGSQYRPTLHIVEGASTNSGAFDNGTSYTVDTTRRSSQGGNCATGSVATLGASIIDFNISAAMTGSSPGLGLSDGVLTGDLVKDTSQSSGTTAQVVFYARIDDAFDCVASGDPHVDQTDYVVNDVTVTGSVLDSSDAPTGSTESDTSSSQVDIVDGSLTKTIYAINGVLGSYTANTVIAPGDTITYRLKYSHTLADMENYTFTDYLPLPVLLSTELTATDTAHPVDDSGTYVASAPPAGTVKFGPADTYASDALWGSGGTRTFPTLTTTGANNSFELNYGTFNNSGNQPAVSDLLYTVTLTDAVFSPGLSLTNLVRVSYNNTFTEVTNSDALEFVELTQPDLRIKKGVVATNQASDAHPSAPTYSPANTGGTWSVPGTSGARFSGTITSTSLAANAINSNLSGVDAGDIVTFAVSLENVGDSRKGAYDVRVRDTLPAGFAIPGSGLNISVTDGTGAAIGTSNIGTGFFDVAGGIELADPGPTAAAVDDTAGGSIDEYSPTSGRNIAIITYDLVVQDAAEIGSQITNVATLTQLHGIEGGTLNYVNAYPASVPTTESAIVTIKHLSATKTLVSADTTRTIGETFQYQVTATVPEGATTSLQLVDTLDSGLAFVSIDSVTSSGIATEYVGGLNQAIADTVFSTVGSAPLGAGRRATIALGNVTNTNHNNTVADTITIVYTVVVLNDASNQQGQTLNNSATISSASSTTTVSAANITVVEPNVTVAKSATPITGDAFDQIEYSMLFTNNSAETAYDIDFTDVLPASTTFDAVFGTAGFDLTSCAASPSSGPSETSGTITATWSTLAAGVTCTIKVRVTLNAGVTPSQVIANTANVTWTSLAGAVANVSSHNTLSDERDGSGGVNNYAAASAVNVTIASITASKTISATSEATTGTNTLTVGEQATYELTITVPEGTSPNLQVADTLPSWMAIATATSAVSVTSDPDLTVTNPTGNPVLSSNGGVVARTMSLDFGTVTNNATNDGNAETIVVTYTGVVLDVAGATRGVTGRNAAVITWGGSPGGTVTAQGPIQTIVEPTLTIDKSSSTAGPIDAGDSAVYTITITKSAASNSDAFGLAFSDTLPSTVDIAGAIVQTSGPSCSITHDGSPSGGGVTGTCAHLATTDANIVFTIPVTVNTTAASGSTITNTGSLAWTTTDNDLDGTLGGNTNGHERTSNTSDPASFTISNARLDKSLVTTSEASTTGSQVAIGELITYQLALEVPEGSMNNVVLRDTLGQGLAFVDVTAITADAGVTVSGGTLGTPPSGFTIAYGNAGTGTVNQGRTMTLTLDDLTNSNSNSTPEHVTVQYRAVALNATVNTRGHAAGNTATVDWATNGAAGPAAAATTPASVTITEPTLTTTKTATPNAGDAGDTVTLTIRIDHTSVSNQDAHDVVFTDTIPAGLTFDGIGTVASTGGANNVGIGTPTFAGSTLTVPIGTIAENGATDQYGEFTFTVSIATSAVASSTIANTGNIAWESLPGGAIASGTDNNPLGVERTGNGTDPGDSNPYVASDTATVTIGGPAVAKDLTNASDTTKSIGETFQYDVTVTFPEGTTNGVTITDTLDAGLAFVRVDSITPSSNAVTSSAGSFATVSNFTNTVTPGGGAFDLQLDDVTNADTNNANADTVTIRYTVVVLNTAANQRGATRNNLAHASYDPGSGAQSLPDVSAPNITIVEPDLTTTKTADVATADGGDTITYTIAVSHTPSSDADAHDVALTDALPAGTTFVPNSVTAVSGVAPGVGSVSGSTLTVPIGSIPLGAQSTFTFQVLVGANLTVGSTIHNEATTTWHSIDGSVDANAANHNAAGVERTGDPADTGGNLNDYSNTASADVGTPVPTFAKALTDGAHTSTPIGDIYQYDVTFTLPEGTTNDVSFTDTLDAGLAFVRIDSVLAPSGVTTNYSGGFAQAIADAEGTISNSGRTMSVDLGDLENLNSSNATPEVLTVRYSVIVLDTANNQRGAARSNAAAASYADGSSTVSLGTANAADVTVSEPTLSITKVADIANADGGDTVTYTVTITHSSASDADAHSVVFDDALPAYTTYTPNSATMTSGTAPDIAFAVATGHLTATWDTIPVGQTRTFTYEVTLDANVPASASLANFAKVDWHSVASVPSDADAFDPDGRPRTGADGAGGALDDYEASATATITVTTPASSKGIDTTSVTSTPADNVVGGEIVTYYVKMHLPEGATSTIDLVDDLPAGTTFVPGSVTIGTASNDPLLGGIAFAGTIAAPVANLSGQQLAMHWAPTTTVTSDNVATNNYVIVRYQARVDANVTPGSTLTNAASISLDGDAAAAMTPVDVHVIAPHLTIEKEVSTDGTSWVSVLDTEPSSASPELFYRLVVTNDGDAPAHDIDVVDNTPTSPIAPFTNVHVATTTGVTIIDGELTVDPDLAWTIATIPAGGTVTLRYSVDLVGSASFHDGDVLSNTAHVPSYWPAPASERDDDSLFTNTTDDPSDTADTTLYFPQLALVKTTGQPDGAGGYIDLPSVGTAELGQPFPWRIDLVNSSTHASAHDVHVHDLLPPGWTYVNGTTTFSSGSAGEPAVSGSPVALNWTLDGNGDPITIPAGATLTISFRAIPTLSAKTAADPHVNVASATAHDGSGTSANADGSYAPADDDAAAHLALPDLHIAKTPDGDHVAPGSLAQFTLNITNTGDGSARNTVISDTIPVGLSYNAAHSLPLPVSVTPNGNGTTTIVWNIGTLGPQNSVVPPDHRVIVLGVDVDADATGNLDNTAAVRSDEYASNGPPADTDTGQLVVDPNAPSFALSSTKTASPVSNGSVNANDPITYTMTYDNAGPGDATGVEMTDILPAEVTFVPGSASPPSINSNAVRFCSACDGSDWTTSEPSSVRGLKWVIGAVPAADLAASVSFAVTVNSGLQLGTRIVNAGVLTSDQGPSGITLGPVEHLGSADPTLTLTKSVDRNTINLDTDPNQLQYSLELANTGAGTSHNTQVVDHVPPTTTLTSIVDGGFTVDCSSNGGAGWGSCPVGLGTINAIRWTIGDLAGNTTTATIGFTADVKIPAVNGTAIHNTGQVTSDETGNVDSNEVTTVVTATPHLLIDKSVTPTGALSPGTPLTYTIHYANDGTAVANDVAINDPIPARTRYVAGSATGNPTFLVGTVESATEPSDPASVTALRWDHATLALNDSKTVRFRVRLDASIDDATSIVNTATISASNANSANDGATVTVNSASKLQVQKIASAQKVAIGDQVVYTLTISNIGNATAHQVAVTDPLPTGLAFVTATNGGALTDSTVVWPTFDLPAGKSSVMTVTTTVLGTGALTNVARVKDITSDGGNGQSPLESPATIEGVPKSPLAYSGANSVLLTLWAMAALVGGLLLVKLTWRPRLLRPVTIIVDAPRGSGTVRRRS